MRNATLSCITFLWMNIRVRWSFQAVGVKIIIISLSLSISPVLSAAGKQSHTLPLLTNFHSPPTVAKWFQNITSGLPQNTIVQSLDEKGQCHSPADYSSLFSFLYISLYFSVSHLCICCVCCPSAFHMCY